MAGRARIEGGRKDIGLGVKLKGAPVMNTTRRNAARHHGRGQRAFRALRYADPLAVLLLFTALPAQAWVWYSGASVGSDGTVYGWGVTDVTYIGMYHTAYVDTTLTSPVKHRQAASGTLSAPNSVRADVYLTWDGTDLGTYTVETWHRGWCFYINYWILQQWSSASATLCGFVIQGAPSNIQCDGVTRNLTLYQAQGIPSQCSVIESSSNLTFVVAGDVTADLNDSYEDYTGEPTLHAYYYAGSQGGAITPEFTIKFYPSLQTVYHSKTDDVCK
jgi:hypothetical protein